VNWNRFPAALAVAASLLCVTTARADAPPCPGPQAPTCIWKGVNPVIVKFNPGLDPALEQVRLYRDGLNQLRFYELGDVNTRWACFQQAVADWNAALAQACNGTAPFQLQAQLVGNAWAVDQSLNAKCVDGGLVNPDDPLLPHLPATGNPVFDRVANYLGDGVNQASTGRGDKKNPMIQPGWIAGDQVGTYDIDQRLGETHYACDNTDAGKLKDADIVWFTHFTAFAAPCPVIPWDYRLLPVAGNPNDPGMPVPYKGGGGKPNPDAFDYYSVMLHELGHLLGLGHMTDPAGGNVMIGSLMPGTRQTISATEIACLKQLYCPQATPARRSTWGGLKSLYR
jgi:hypothetical protein